MACLKGQFEEVKKVLWCHVTLNYSFSVEVNDENRVFAIFCSLICEKTVRHKNYVNGQILGELVWAFQRQVNPSHYKNKKIATIWLFGLI